MIDRFAGEFSFSCVHLRVYRPNPSRRSQRELLIYGLLLLLLLLLLLWEEDLKFSMHAIKQTARGDVSTTTVVVAWQEKKQSLVLWVHLRIKAWGKE